MKLLFFLIILVFVSSKSRTNKNGIVSLECNCGDENDSGESCNFVLHAGESQYGYTEDIKCYILNCTTDFSFFYTEGPDYFLEPFEKTGSSWMELTFKYLCNELSGCSDIEARGMGSCYGRTIECESR